MAVGGLILRLGTAEWMPFCGFTKGCRERSSTVRLAAGGWSSSGQGRRGELERGVAFVVSVDEGYTKGVGMLSCSLALLAANRPSKSYGNLC